MTKSKSILPIVLLIVFLDLLGVGILIPVLPQLFVNPYSADYVLTPDLASQALILFGFLSAVYPFFQFLAAPILGQLSDKFGRKPILAFSLAGTALGYVLFALGILTKNLPLLFAARALDGFTGGNISVAQASLADITEPKDRAKTFGLIGMAFGLGFILGPYLGGKLADPTIVSWFSATTPFWFTAILSALNVILVMFLFPETHQTIEREKKIKIGQAFTNIKKAFTIPGLSSIFATNFLFTGGFTFFTTFFGVFLISKFAFTEGNIGDFFAYVGLWIAITQGLITRNIANRFSEDSVLKVSFIMTGIAVFLYFLPTQAWQLLLVTPLFAIFNGLTQANSSGLISRSANKEIQGEVLGINSSVAALAQAIPPVLSGYIATSLDATTPILVSGIVMAIAGVFFVVTYQKPANLNNEPVEAVAAH